MLEYLFICAMGILVKIKKKMEDIGFWIIAMLYNKYLMCCLVRIFDINIIFRWTGVLLHADFLRVETQIWI